MQKLDYIAPSVWASALVNCDYSGLQREDIVALNTWLAVNHLSFVDCVMCEDVGFMRYHDAFEQMPLAADCSKYTFLIGG